MALHMPAEWDRHERTWMAWPSQGYTLGDSEAEADEARSTWAAVANATVDFEPVTMLVPRHELEHARRLCSGQVELLEAELNDAWMRDIGPTFVHERDDQGNTTLAAVKHPVHGGQGGGALVVAFVHEGRADLPHPSVSEFGCE